MQGRKRSIMGRLLGYLTRHWQGYLVGGSYLILVEATGQVLVALMLKLLIDAAIIGSLGQLLSSVLWFGLALLASSALMPGAMRMLANAVESGAVDLRQDLFEHSQALPMSYHEENHSGDLVTRMTNDVTKAFAAIGSDLFDFLSAVITGICCTFIMGLISWKLVILVLFLGTVPILLNRYAAAPMRQASAAAQASLATLNARLKDILVGMPIIRSYNLEQHFTSDYAAANADTRRLGIVVARREGINVVSNDTLASATFLSVLACGSYLMLLGELTAGEVVAAVQLCNGITNPMRRLGELWVKLQSSLGAADRIFAVLDEPVEQLVSNGATADMTANGAMVSLHDVAFAYDAQHQVLSGINLQVAPGSVVALAGPSGGGKSTIFKLLLGFYQANTGTCYLASRPLSDYTLEQLREQIAFVPQDSYLFAGTVYENIAYGRPHATADEIYEAARAANAHDFIVELPEGYSTQVGERGTQLSGGQRQRIAIARAVLKDAPLLLLDEATSSLDSESEHLVQEALTRLMQGRTTLVIAHRLSTIENADCIHVVADGRIVESGTHAKLLQQDGLYRKLYEIQLQAA